MKQPFFETGIVYKIYDPVNLSSKTTKQEFVLVKAFKKGAKKERDYIKFTVFNKSIDKIKNLNPGDYIEVYFYVRGQRWQKHEDSPELFYVNLFVTNVINRGRGAMYDIKDASDNTEAGSGENVEMKIGGNDLPIEGVPEQDEADEIPF